MNCKTIVCFLTGIKKPGTGETETTTRVSKKLVTFQHSFLLEEIEKELPAGDYTIETTEESIEGLTFQAFRRVETFLVVRPPKGKPGSTRLWSIDPEALALALASDVERSLESHSDCAEPASPTPFKPKSSLPHE